jgi:hypothetical protein
MSDENIFIWQCRGCQVSLKVHVTSRRPVELTCPECGRQNVIPETRTGPAYEAWVLAEKKRKRETALHEKIVAQRELATDAPLERDAGPVLDGPRPPRAEGFRAGSSPEIDGAAPAAALRGMGRYALPIAVAVLALAVITAAAVFLPGKKEKLPSGKDPEKTVSSEPQSAVTKADPAPQALQNRVLTESPAERSAAAEAAMKDARSGDRDVFAAARTTWAIKQTVHATPQEPLWNVEMEKTRQAVRARLAGEKNYGNIFALKEKMAGEPLEELWQQALWDCETRALREWETALKTARELVEKKDVAAALKRVEPFAASQAPGVADAAAKEIARLTLLRLSTTANAGADPPKEQPKDPAKEQPGDPAKEQPKDPPKEQPKEQTDPHVVYQEAAITADNEYDQKMLVAKTEAAEAIKKMVDTAMEKNNLDAANALTEEQHNVENSSLWEAKTKNVEILKLKVAYDKVQRDAEWAFQKKMDECAQVYLKKIDELIRQEMKAKNLETTNALTEMKKDLELIGCTWKLSIQVMRGYRPFPGDYTVTFLPAGVLRMQVPQGTTSNGTWHREQNGEITMGFTIFGDYGPSNVSEPMKVDGKNLRSAAPLGTSKMPNGMTFTRTKVYIGTWVGKAYQHPKMKP